MTKLHLVIFAVFVVLCTCLNWRETRGTIDFDPSTGILDNRQYTGSLPFPFQSISPAQLWGTTKEWLCYHRNSAPRNLVIVFHGSASRIESSQRLADALLGTDKFTMICGVNFNDTLIMEGFNLTFVVHTPESKAIMMKQFIDEVILSGNSPFQHIGEDYSVVSYSAGSTPAGLLAASDERVKNVIYYDPVDCPPDLWLFMGMPATHAPGLKTLLESNRTELPSILIFGADERLTGSNPALTFQFTYKGCDARAYNDKLMQQQQNVHTYITYAGATHGFSEFVFGHRDEFIANHANGNTALFVGYRDSSF
jgi:hypothetical protein